MGEVFAARHLTLRTEVALKVLRARRGRSSSARLLREARATSSLTSEHVVRVLDAGELQDGSPFLVMERLRGVDVAAALTTHGRLDPSTAIAIVIQACHAVGEAHAAGIVHRDLKPSNLFLCRRKEAPPIVKVLDFGIAKTLEEDGIATTTTGAVMGSPQYMSPEQIRNPREVDARSDVWSLGVTLCQLLTGQPPFSSRFASALCAMITSDPPTLHLPEGEGVHPGLEAIVARCLEKSPDARFADVGALAAALRELAPEAAITIEVDAGADTRAQAPGDSDRANADDSASGPSVTLLDSYDGGGPRASFAVRDTRPRSRRRSVGLAAALVIGGAGLGWTFARTPPPQPSFSASGADSGAALPEEAAKETEPPRTRAPGPVEQNDPGRRDAERSGPRTGDVPAAASTFPPVVSPLASASVRHRSSAPVAQRAMASASAVASPAASPSPALNSPAPAAAESRPPGIDPFTGLPVAR